jgi:hypothetical protein
MMIYKSLISSIIKCLTELLDQDDLTASSRESLEVSIQCLESAYDIQTSDAALNFDILQIFKTTQLRSKEVITSEANNESKIEAERLKNKGNQLMEMEKYHEALINYTKYEFYVHFKIKKCILSAYRSFEIIYLMCLLLIINYDKYILI